MAFLKYVVMENQEIYFTSGMGSHKNLVEENETPHSAGTISVTNGKWKWLDDRYTMLRISRDIELDSVLISAALGFPWKGEE